jgi:hypothetical protein
MCNSDVNDWAFFLSSGSTALFSFPAMAAFF